MTYYMKWVEKQEERERKREESENEALMYLCARVRAKDYKSVGGAIFTRRSVR